jgi:hypothetical protein
MQVEKHTQKYWYYKLWNRGGGDIKCKGSVITSIRSVARISFLAHYSSNYSSYKTVKMTPGMVPFLAMLIASSYPALEEESE